MSRRRRKAKNPAPSMPTGNPQDVDALHRVILAGQQILYDPKTFPLFKNGMMRKGPLPQILATEAAGLIKMLDDKSKSTIPRQILAPAATGLLLEMVKFMVQAGLAKPSPADVKQAIALLMQLLLKIYQPGQQAQGAQPQQPQAAPQQPPGAPPLQQPPPQAAAPQTGLIGA